MQATESLSEVFKIERPSPNLLRYYVLKCLLTGPLFPFFFVPHFFRYHTLRYRFDEEGISMRWGILFRREIVLNYSRIQDIHLSSNVVERWLGLARVQIQTASGSASAEMTLEGLIQFAAVRDFLYAKMRGVNDPGRDVTRARAETVAGTESNDSQLVQVLQEVAGELRALREAVERKQG